MTTPQQGELLIASIVQALLDIREEFFTMNKTLERLVNCLEGEEAVQVKETNSWIKDFFSNVGKAS